MKEKDLNKIAEIEKAIKKKYGEEAIKNPKGSWNQEKENKYLSNLKQFHNKSKKRKQKIEEQEGFIVKEKKVKTCVDRVCPVCNSYSFAARDDLYMIKFNCCYNCFIEYIEGREQRWKSGWRPNN